MWPFKSKIPTIEKIITEDQNEQITIIHEKGAHKFKREDIIELTLGSDIFSPSKSVSTKRNSGVYTWEFYLSFAVFGGFMNSFFSILAVDGWEEGQLPIFLLESLVLALILSVLFHWLLTHVCKYFLLHYFENDKYSKDILKIKLNNLFLKLRLNQEHLRILKYLTDNPDQNDIKDVSFIKDFEQIKAGRSKLDVSIIDNLCILITFALCGLICYNYFSHNYDFTFWFLEPGIYLETRGGSPSHYYEYFFVKRSFLETFYHGFISSFLLIPSIIILMLVSGLLFYVTIYAPVLPIHYLFFMMCFGPYVEVKSRFSWKLLTLLSFILILVISYLCFRNNWIVVIFTLGSLILYLGRSMIIKAKVLYHERQLIWGIMIPYWLLLIGSLFHIAESLEITNYFVIVYVIIVLLYGLYMLVALVDYDIPLKSTKSRYFHLYKNYRPMVERWIKQNPLLLEELPKKWSRAYDVVSIALRENPKSFHFACLEIKNDQEFIKKEIAFLFKNRRYNQEPFGNWMLDRKSWLSGKDLQTFEILVQYLDSESISAQ